MTDREWAASHCVECWQTDPGEGWHERCGCHETRCHTTEPDDVSAGQCGTLETASQTCETPASTAIDRGRGHDPSPEGDAS